MAGGGGELIEDRSVDRGVFGRGHGGDAFGDGVIAVPVGGIEAPPLLLVAGIATLTEDPREPQPDVTSAALSELGAWLSAGRTIVHINAATGTPDAIIDHELVGEAGDQEVVATADGVAVVDSAAGTVTTLDTTRLTPGATATLPDGTGRSRWVVAGGFGYLIGDDTVQPVDPVTLEPVRPAISVGDVGGAVTTEEGALAVLDAEAGRLIHVVDGVAEPAAEVVQHHSPDQLALTAVGGRPVVVDTGAGAMHQVGPDGRIEGSFPVEELAGVSIADLAVADPHTEGSTAWVVLRETGRLLGVDLNNGEVRSAQLDRSGDGVQAPVVVAGMVYVPHGGSHDVTVVDGRTGEPRQVARHVPEGDGGRLEVFVQDGRVWINDPTARTALVVEPSGGGTATTIDKGPAGAVRVPNVTGMSRTDACAALAAERLGCSWEVNPVNSIGDPAVADSQSIAASTTLPPETTVTVWHPAGPDVTLHRFRAYSTDGRPLEAWAVAPDGGPGRSAYDLFLGPDQAALWRPDGTVGRCYSTQVEGSVPLYDFIRRNPNDPNHEQHFYAAGGPGDEQYERGMSYYDDPQALCYVIPWDAAPGAAYVTEWGKGDDSQFYTVDGEPPGTGYTQVLGHWMSW